MNAKFLLRPRWVTGTRVGVSLMVLAIGTTGLVTARAQTVVSCPVRNGLIMVGQCTYFGYGADDDIRAWAKVMVAGTGHQNTNFCNEIWGWASSWVRDHMDLVYGSATLNGVAKDALSEYDANNWLSGWLGEWLRDSTISEIGRGSILSDFALEEGAHRACDESDFGSCDSSDERAVEQALEDCYGED